LYVGQLQLEPGEKAIGRWHSSGCFTDYGANLGLIEECRLRSARYIVADGVARCGTACSATVS